MVNMKTRENVVLIHPDAKSATEVLELLCEPALANGYINEEYFTNLTNREVEYPTGLMVSVPLAIPHIAEGCVKSFVALAILEEPIEFGSMDGSDDKVPVELVFMFGIVNPKEQVEVLKIFAKSFGNIEIMERLKSSKTEREALEALKEVLGDTIDIED